MIQIITYYELLKNNYKTLQRQQQNNNNNKDKRQKRYRKNKRVNPKRGMKMEMESHLVELSRYTNSYEMSPYFQNFEQLQK